MVLYNFGYSICANPDTDHDEVVRECDQECDDEYLGGVTKWFVGGSCKVNMDSGDFGERDLSNAGIDETVPDCKPSNSVELSWSTHDCINVRAGAQATNDACGYSDDINYAGDPIGQYSAALTAASGAEISVGDYRGSAALYGTVSYTILPDPRFLPCPAGGCEIGLLSMAIGVYDFEVEGVPVQGASARSVGIMAGTWRPDGSVVVPAAQVRLQTNFYVNGKHGSALVTASEDVIGRIDPFTGGLELPSIRAAGSGVSVRFALQGTSRSTPPVAWIANPRRFVECDAPGIGSVVLDGTRSFDRDGDTLAYRWFVRPQDGGEADLGQGSQVSVTAPLGDYVIGLGVVDGRLATGVDAFAMTVRDTQPPTVTVVEAQPIYRCTPAPVAVAVHPPIVGDICTPDDIFVEGAVVARNGSPLPARVPLVAGEVSLREGSYEVEWVVTDGEGNVAVATQTVKVVDRVDVSCCPEGSERIWGTSRQDALYPQRAACVFALGGGDQVVASAQPDFIAGGDGADQLVGSGDGDTFLGGKGQDSIVPSFPSGQGVEAFGMEGGDSIQAVYAGSATLYGGAGDDHIVGSYGADYIVPGPGRDAAQGLDGDDTVVVFDLCELQSGESLDGGAGMDTLVSPVDIAILQSRGVTVTGFERVVVDATQRHLSECI